MSDVFIAEFGERDILELWFVPLFPEDFHALLEYAICFTLIARAGGELLALVVFVCIETVVNPALDSISENALTSHNNHLSIRCVIAISPELFPNACHVALFVKCHIE